VTGNPYETGRYLSEYLLFHYGQPEDVRPFHLLPPKTLRFHERIVRECLLPLRFSGPTRALDIGCGVGRLTFELGRVVDRAVGIDNSRRFIHAARQMQRLHAVSIRVHESGTQFRSLTVTLPKELKRSVTEFRVGNGQDLTTFPDESFHVVTAINVICRLPKPRQFLTQLHRLIVPGGQLVIGSPFSWLEDFTPRREWLTAKEVESLLRPHFRLARRRDLAFLLREHRRKYQLVVSDILVFQHRETNQRPTSRSRRAGRSDDLV